jgi:CheY-like chemotaxis protein
MKIICVDDDPVFLSILEECLAAQGYGRVRAFQQSVEVAILAEAGRLEADVFLLDVEMPGLNGIELCAALRAAPGHEATPIIMISSVTSRARITEALAAGASDYLSKPLDPVELGARLSMVERVVLERRRSATLERDMGSLQDQPGFGFRFEDAVLPGQDAGLIDFLALENALLALGWAGMQGRSLLAFRLCNAGWGYAHLGRLAYFDFLSEAAAMIQSQMSGQRYQMAYAGAGDFVALLDRGTRVEAADLQAGLSGTRGPYFDAYRRLGVPAPEIAVGAPQPAPLLAPSPRRLIAAARAAVALPPAMLGLGGKAEAGLAARA